MQPATYIIGKQKIKIAYQGSMDPLTLQQSIREICSNELPKKLEALLDRYDDSNLLLKLEKLEIKLVLNDGAGFADRLTAAILEQIEIQLRMAVLANGTSAVTVAGSQLQAFVFYLENGFLPWWVQGNRDHSFRQSLQQFWKNGKFQDLVKAVLPVLKEKPARKRFLSFLDQSKFESFVQACGFFAHEEWLLQQELLNKLSEFFSTDLTKAAFENIKQHAVLWVIASGFQKEMAAAAILSYVATTMPDPQKFRKKLQDSSFLEQLKQPPNEAYLFPTKSLLQQQDKAILSPPVKESPVFIKNAGLVILAPFLPAFFAELGILQNDELSHPEHAITLLHFLTFGTAAFEEWEVPLEKILTGYPLSDSLPKRKRVTKKQIAQSEILLNAVIEHWQALKNTSPDGLRHNFLHREGKLIFKNNQWELTVQKQTHDILLDYIPWSISMIKLPWMPQLLIVKWD